MKYENLIYNYRCSVNTMPEYVMLKMCSLGSFSVFCCCCCSLRKFKQPFLPTMYLCVHCLLFPFFLMCINELLPYLPGYLPPSTNAHDLFDLFHGMPAMVTAKRNNLIEDLIVEELLGYPKVTRRTIAFDDISFERHWMHKACKF